MAFQVCVPATDWSKRLAALLTVDYPGLGALQALTKDMQAWPSPASIVADYMGQLDAALRPLRPIALILQAIAAILNCVNATKDAIIELSPDPIIDCLENLKDVVNKLAAYIPPIPYLRAMGGIVLAAIMYIDEMRRALHAIDARITQLNAIQQRAATLQDANLLLVADCVQAEINAAKESTLGGLESLMLIIGNVLAIVRILADIAGLDPVVAGVEQVEEDINAEDGVPGLDTLVRIVTYLRPVLVELYRLLTFPLGEFVDPGDAPDIPFVN